MRILRIAHASLTPQLRERERALARCYPDVELEVVTTDRWREAEVEVEATDDDLFPVRKVHPYLSRHIQLFAYDPRSIVAAMRAHRPHLIDLNAEPFSVQCAEVLTLRNWFAPRVPVVLQCAQNILRDYPPPFGWFRRRAAKQVAAAYVCSETVRDVLRETGFEKPVRIIPFGVNLEAFYPRVASHRDAAQPLTIGFVGRMFQGKGLSVLAHALAKLSKEDWRLLVVGDGPARESFTQMLDIFGLTPRTRFTGAVGYEQLPELYRQMDIVVVPSRNTKRVREQFGRVIVEAMASGVPVIGSDSGAIPEVIGGAGLVVPQADADALAAAIRELLTNENMRREFALAGRERVARNYSWELVAGQMHELFSEVLKPSVATDMTRRVEAAA